MNILNKQTPLLTWTLSNCLVGETRKIHGLAFLILEMQYVAATGKLNINFKSGRLMRTVIEFAFRLSNDNTQKKLKSANWKFLFHDVISNLEIFMAMRGLGGIQVHNQEVGKILK